MKYTENAVSEKVHALFAKTLTDSDYENMMSFHTEEELFNYLHNETAYSDVIGSLPSVKLSRSRFENVIRKISLDREASICRFQKLIGDKTYRYFIIKDEIETIIYCARHLDTPIITNLFERPSVYKSEQCISGEELQKATSFEEFVNMLLPTRYGKLLEPLVNSENAYISLAALERILYNNLYSETETIIKKNYIGKSRAEIIDYIKFVSDMNIISSLYRLIENYPGDVIYKTGMFMSDVTAFTEKQLSEMKAAKTGQEVLDIVKSSVYKKYFTGEITNIDLFVRKKLIGESIKNIHFSDNPVLVVFSYETIAKNEIQNIIHIIEGIKYNLSHDEISEIIVKGGC